MEIKFERDGDYLIAETKDDSLCLYPMHGHTGYIRQAARLLGLEIYGQERAANQTGLSNPDVYIRFPNGPDEDLRKQLWVKYGELWDKQIENRKKGIKKPPSIKTPRTESKPPKPLKTYEVYCAATDESERKRFPSHIVQAANPYKAKEAYDEWYERTNNGWSNSFYMKSREIAK